MLTRIANKRFIRKSEERQEIRNERAQQALLRLTSGQGLEHPIIVFLRPFKATKEYAINLGTTEGGFQGSSALPSSRRLEIGLAKLVAAFGDFIALGSEFQEKGAGRINTSDEEWKETVQNICDGAQAIIMFPSVTPGTSWEAVLLKEQNYIAKTVFLMPPLVYMEMSPRGYRLFDRILSISKTYRESGRDTESGTRVTTEGGFQGLNEHAPQDWDLAHSIYAKFGISLPIFEDYGLAFYLNEKGQSVPLCPLFVKQSEMGRYVDKNAAGELQKRIARISQSLYTDWFPTYAAFYNPYNHYLLPLLSHLADLVERVPRKLEVSPEEQR
jgi:hypothetical protein